MITIDGREIEFEPGTTVLETALAHDIDIPRLCYHPALEPSGGCRLCTVEIGERGTLAASCGLACEEGMVVRTQSEQLTAMRRDILDLFISEHPLNCATCVANGACDLQTYAYQFDIAETSFDTEVSRTLFQDDNPFFVRDHQYCILCGKCVRVCNEVVGADAIEYAGRGFDSHIATPFDGIMVDSSCLFCSSCVQVCPTAALFPKPRLGKGRDWEFQRKRTVCGYCGVGCNVEFLLRDGTIIDAQGYAGAPVNGEFLCVKGRSGWDFIDSPDRLTEPLVRRDLAYELGLTDDPWTLPETSPLKERKGRDYFVRVPWETAIEIVADKLAGIIRGDSGDAVAGLSSARCTNEENYLFQKFMRAGVGTNNVDHCARLCHASTVTGLGLAFGSGAMTNSINEIRDSDCILITGSNTAESHPVISYEVVRAVNKGASLIVIDPRRTPMVEHASLWLQPTPGTDIYIFLAMAHMIVREGWADQAFIESRTAGYDEFAAVLPEYTPEMAALQTGVPAEDIELAAQLYALGQRRGAVELAGTYIGGSGSELDRDSSLASSKSEISDVDPLRMTDHRSSDFETRGEDIEDHSQTNGHANMPVASLSTNENGRGDSSILYAMGITQRTNGTDLVMSLANLAMLSGQIGRPSTGVNPLRGQSNVQGACDLGALPNVLPGYQPVSDDDKRRAVAAGWGLDDLTDVTGLTVVEMTHASIDGRVRAMYIMGENPMLSDPNITHVEEGLRALDFLVVQDIFLSESALLAHVVLPAAASLEKDGTITNTERRVQQIHPIVEPPGQAWPDWQITGALGAALAAKLDRGDGIRWQFDSTEQIMAEAASVTPIYGGIIHGRLTSEELTWPCPTAGHPGTPILHTEQFSRGPGQFHAVRAQLPAEMPDDEFPLILSTGRILYHYHTGTMTRRSEGLDWREPRGFAEINPADADAANLRDGGPVVIHSRRGQVRTQARFSERVQPGVVFLSFHWKEAPANVLTQDHALDPLAKIPEYKVSAVRLENPSRRQS